MKASEIRAQKLFNQYLELAKKKTARNIFPAGQVS